MATRPSRNGWRYRANVAARVKGQGMDYMHLKTFQVDGRWLRTGSTNFSFAGQRRQDNDIIVLESRAVAEAFIQQHGGKLVRFEEVTPASYFMACGWGGGYFGVQELKDGRRVALFSVWDPTKGDDPKAVRPEDRVELLHEGEGVRIRRFGGEGSDE